VATVQAEEQMSETDEKTLTGVISKFNPESGFGMISCGENQEFFFSKLHLNKDN
jgi:hypothetical protein